MDLQTQIAASAALSFAIQAAKRAQSIPWISKETPKLTRAIAFIGSGLVALGLHATYSAVNHSLVITGLDAATIGAGLWHWFTQFAITHGWYQATKDRTPQ